MFTAVLRTIPAFAAWLEAMDPITDVFPMAGLHNTLRRLVADGAPVATGLHAIGDSVCTTNPTLGRGLALALSGAADLVDAIGENAADPGRAGARPGSPCRRARGAVLRRSGRDRRRAAGDDAAHNLRRATARAIPDPRPGQLSQLRAAVSFDPTAFRALWKINGMVCPPDEVYTDPDVIACTQEALRRLGAAPPAARPTREQLLTALIATGSDSGSPPSSGP